MPIEFPDMARVALLGQACGDAFGAPFEYHPDAPEMAQLSMREERYLDGLEDVGVKPKWWRQPGLYTDDTQQALCLLRARQETSSPEKAAEFFHGHCKWLATLNCGKEAQFGAHRGTGGNFRMAIRTGRPVTTAGLGAAMRVGPVAMTFDDPEEMVHWLIEVSKVTTIDPIGLASAVKFACICWGTYHPNRRIEFKDLVWPTDSGVTEEAWDLTTEALYEVRDDEEAFLEWAAATGLSDKPLKAAASGFGLTGFAWAVEAAMMAGTFEEAMVNVCRSGGDTDTVAAMAGCLAAIRFGEEGIPEWMLKGLCLDPTKNWGETNWWNPTVEMGYTRTEVTDRFRQMHRIRAYGHL